MYRVYPGYTPPLYLKLHGCSNSHSQGMFLFKALYWGQKGARDNFSFQIQNIVEHAYKSLGEMPVVIGECGVPMDLKLVFTSK